MRRHHSNLILSFNWKWKTPQKTLARLLCFEAVYWKWCRRRRWDDAASSCLFVWYVFFPPVRFTLRDVNTACSQFPGENQSDGFRRRCSRFTTQLLASLWLPLLPLFPTVESHTSMACPSMILIASGTVATSVGDELWWLVMKMKSRSGDPLLSNGRNPFLAPPWIDSPCKPPRTGSRGVCGMEHRVSVGAPNTCCAAWKQLWQHQQIFCLFS